MCHAPSFDHHLVEGLSNAGRHVQTGTVLGDAVVGCHHSHPCAVPSVCSGAGSAGVVADVAHLRRLPSGDASAVGAVGRGVRDDHRDAVDLRCVRGLDDVSAVVVFGGDDGVVFVAHTRYTPWVCVASSGCKPELIGLVCYCAPCQSRDVGVDPSDDALR